MDLYLQIFQQEAGLEHVQCWKSVILWSIRNGPISLLQNISVRVYSYQVKAIFTPMGLVAIKKWRQKQRRFRFRWCGLTLTLTDNACKNLNVFSDLLKPHGITQDKMIPVFHLAMDFVLVFSYLHPRVFMFSATVCKINRRRVHTLRKQKRIFSDMGVGVRAHLHLATAMSLRRRSRMAHKAIPQWHRSNITVARCNSTGPKQ